MNIVQVCTLVVVIGILAIFSPARAAKIGLNFVGGSAVNGTPALMGGSETAGYAPQRFWNNLSGASGTAALQGDAGGDIAAFYAGLSVNYWAVLGTKSTAITDAGGNSRVLKGFLSADNTSGGAAEITVTGVPFTSSGYAVIVYFDGDNGSYDRVTKISMSASGFGTRSVYGLDKGSVDFSGTFKRVPATSNSDLGGATPDGNYVIFSVLNDSTFTVTVNGGTSSDGVPRGAINAIQIVDLNSLPESPAPVITSAATASAAVGGAFSYTITADYSPTNFTATGLPSGLSLNPITGVISGTPTVAGSFSVTLGARNAAGLGTKLLTLTVSAGTGSNDHFSSRLALAGLPVSASASSATATKEQGEPNHAGYSGGRSLWWSWTASTNGKVSVTTAGSSFDTLLAVYTGSSVSGLSLVASNDEFYDDHTSMLIITNAVAGTTYHIAVDDYEGVGGSVELTITAAPSIQMVSPADGSVFGSPTSITLAATAADADGTISRVYFYTNGNAAGWSAVAPYQVVLTNPAAGAYSIDAIAVDDLGGAAYSDRVRITVNSNNFGSTKLETGVTNTLLDVWFANSLVGYACGSDGALLGTWDGGGTWTRLFGDFRTTLWSVQAVGPAIVIAGDKGLLATSYDGGLTWSSVFVGESVQFYAASMIAPYSGFAVGANGIVYTLNGTNWVQQASGTAADLLDVVAIGSTGYAVGVGGVILRYNGSQWVAQTSGTTATLYGVGFCDANFGYAVGTGGTIRRTSNAGTNWVGQVSGVTNTLRRVFVLDANVAWCIGDGGIVLQTINGGSTWTLMRSGGADLRGISFSGGRGIVVGWGGSAYDFVYKPIAVNLPPSVTLLSPTFGAAFYAGTTVNLAATANDSSGISRIEFYAGSTLVGTSATGGSIGWSPSAAGSYSLTALAFDNQGAYASSSPVNVTVLPAADLVVSMASNRTAPLQSETISFNISVTNRGPSTATTVVLKNIMPSGFEFASATSSQGAVRQSGNTLWADLGALPSEGSASVTVSVVAGWAGAMRNYATVQSGTMDLNSADNTVIYPVAVAGRTFGYSGSLITIRDTNSASEYPATVSVSDLPGVVSKVTVTLSNLAHAYARDLDILLVSPTGHAVLLMSDAGAVNSSISAASLTFDDEGESGVSNTTALSAGVFRTGNFYGNDANEDLFFSPAPAGPYSSALSSLSGIGPNGTWSLYVMDDEGRDSGTLGGWSLSVATKSSENSPKLYLNHSGVADVLRWPSTSADFKVQTTVDLNWPVSWTNLLQVPASANGQNVLTNSTPNQLRFYRLRKSP